MHLKLTKPQNGYSNTYELSHLFEAWFYYGNNIHVGNYKRGDIKVEYNDFYKMFVINLYELIGNKNTLEHCQKVCDYLKENNYNFKIINKNSWRRNHTESQQSLDVIKGWEIWLYLK